MSLVDLALAPFRGFKDSASRLEIGGNWLTSASCNWLLGRGVLIRRAGSAIALDTLSAGAEVAGLLESKWGALARRMLPVRLPSAADGMPTWAILYMDEADREAQLAFLSTNGTDDVRVIGQEHGVYHYGWSSTRSDGVPTLRCIPHVWEDENGGQCLGRLVSGEQRRRLLAGSRDVVQNGHDICWPGYDSAPGRWSGRWNDSAATGDEKCEVSPLGMIPPLQVPSCSKGNDQGETAGSGPWLGSDAFCYTCLFENEDGELSAYPIPRLPNVPWDDHPGFGYMQVDPDNEDHYFDSVVFSNIPIGPPGTRYVHILRSTKVDVSDTDNANFPAPGELYFCGRVPNGVTTYVDSNGNDLSLDADPRIARLLQLVWPPRGRYMGRFAGHYVIGDLRPSPHALLICPWMNGQKNLSIDDYQLYGDPPIYVAVTPTQLVLRSLVNGVASDKTFDLDSYTIREIVDELCTARTANTVTKTMDFATPLGSGADPNVPASYDTPFKLSLTTPGAWSGVPVGARVSSSAFPTDTHVVEILDAVTGEIRVDNPCLRNSVTGGESVDFIVPANLTGMTSPYGAREVPGADADESADELMRTRVPADCSWASGGKVLSLAGASKSYVEHITKGMRVFLDGAFADPTVVTDTDADACTVTVDTAALRVNAGTSEEVLFAHTTGDSTAEAEGSGSVAAVGTYSTKVADTLTSASVALASGSTIVVALATRSHDYGSAYFGSRLMTCAGSAGSGDAVTELWFFSNNTGATITAAASIRVGDDAATSMCVSTIAGTALTASLDKAVAAAGASGSPSSGSTGTLAQTNEICIGVVGTDGASSQTAGSWDAGWTGLQRVGTTGGSDATVATAYCVVAATTAVAAGKTGMTSEDWSAICATFRVATVVTVGHGFVRTFGNGWPVVLDWRKSYLGRFRPQRQSLIFSGADPGHAQYAVNSWYVNNRRTAPADMGLMMGFADMDQALLVFYTRGRMLLANMRTGETHNDDDYALANVSAYRGCRSPWSIVGGNGWAFFLNDDGLFACDGSGNEVLISRDIYDAERPAGKRGLLEYAIGQCLIASELETPGATEYALTADLRGSVLCVHFKKSAASTCLDYEVRYDFSESSGRTGMAEVLRDDGSPYGWSAPLPLPGSCSCRMVTATGLKSYMARDTNAGTADGRVDEVDTGTEDNGESVVAVGYTGLATDPGGRRVVPQGLLFVGHKHESGLSLAVATDPETDPVSAEWLDVPLPAAGSGDYVRALLDFPARSRHDRSAMAFRIMDDGSGDRPEVMRLTPRVEPQEGNI